MTAPVVIISLLGCAAAAWWLTQTYEQMKHTGRVRELESKIRLAQGETYKLREQLGLLKGEQSVVLLKDRGKAPQIQKI